MIQSANNGASKNTLSTIPIDVTARILNALPDSGHLASSTCKHFVNAYFTLLRHKLPNTSAPVSSGQLKALLEQARSHRMKLFDYVAKKTSLPIINPLAIRVLYIQNQLMLERCLSEGSETIEMLRLPTGEQRFSFNGSNAALHRFPKLTRITFGRNWLTPANFHNLRDRGIVVRNASFQTSSHPAHALREHAVYEGVKILKMGDRDLSELSDDFFTTQFPEIEVLEFQNLPKEEHQFPRIKEVRLNGMHFSTIPNDFFERFPKLESIALLGGGYTANTLYEHFDKLPTLAPGKLILEGVSALDLGAISLDFLQAMIDKGYNFDTDLSQLAMCMHTDKKLCLDAARLLLNSGADVNKSQRGQTPLMGAAMQGTAEMVALLLEYGADPDAVDQLDEQSALHYTVRYSNPKSGRIIDMLIHGGANMDLLDRARRTPLDNAKLYYSSPAATRRLITWGAQSHNDPLLTHEEKGTTVGKAKMAVWNALACLGWKIHPDGFPFH